MAWTNPTTQSTGTLITATIWNTDIVDNLTALRSGSVALTSQATGDVIYASSSTQFGRVAIGTSGYVLTSNGSAPTWSNTPTLTGTNFTGIPAAGVSSGTFAGSTAAVFGGTLAWGGGSAISSSGNVAVLNAANQFSYNGSPITLTGATARIDSSSGAGPLTLRSVANDLYIQADPGASSTKSIIMSASNGPTMTLNNAGLLTVSGAIESSTATSYVKTTSTTGTQPSWFEANNTGGVAYFGQNSSDASFFGGTAYATTIYTSGTGGVQLIATNGASGDVRLYSRNALALTLGASQAASFTGDLSLAATKKLYLDGGGDTYIHESSANRIAFVSGGTEMFVVNSGVPINLSKEALGVEATKKLYLDGGGDTYIYEGASNDIYIVTGGTHRGGWNANGVYVNTYPTAASAANLWSQNGSNIHISTSSIRYKHDIDTLDADHALSAVMAMRPVTYRGKTDEDQRRYVGFIAEEMQTIAPLLATYDEGGESGTPNYVTYDRVTAYLVAVVQKQQAEIDALKARIQ